MASVDVLIIGAGPTGLTLACECARHGVSFRLIDKAAEASTHVKATVVTSHTLDIFEDLGFIDRVLDCGVRQRGFEIYAEGRTILAGDYDELQAPYPFATNLGQDHTERFLIDCLASYGFAVDREVELLTFTEESDQVVAQLRLKDGQEERVTTRYLVGCDGARSTVREQLQWELAGETYPQAFILADVAMDWAMSDDVTRIFLTKEGVWGASPLPHGRWQVGGEVPLSRLEEEAPTLEEVQELWDQRAPFPARLKDPTWLTTYRVHQRVVQTMQRGKIFLAGDAAHLASPFGGLGMNAGIQDSYNLGWKLALVLKGEAQEAILESYSVERLMAIKQVLQISGLNHRLFTVRYPVARELRNHLMQAAFSFDLVWDRLSRQNMQLDWHYRKSPIVAQDASFPLHGPRTPHLSDHTSCAQAWLYFGSGPQAGDQAPDCEGLLIDGAPDQRLLPHLRHGRHHLLLFLGCTAPDSDRAASFDHLVSTLAQRYASVMTVHVVVPGNDVEGLQWEGSIIYDPEGRAHDKYGARGECLYLIRPDGYVGYRCQPPTLESIETYLSGFFSEQLIAHKSS